MRGAEGTRGETREVQRVTREAAKPNRKPQTSDMRERRQREVQINAERRERGEVQRKVQKEHYMKRGKDKECREEAER